MWLHRNESTRYPVRFQGLAGAEGCRPARRIRGLRLRFCAGERGREPVKGWPEGLGLLVRGKGLGAGPGGFPGAAHAVVGVGISRV